MIRHFWRWTIWLGLVAGLSSGQRLWGQWLTKRGPSKTEVRAQEQARQLKEEVEKLKASLETLAPQERDAIKGLVPSVLMETKTSPLLETLSAPSAPSATKKGRGPGWRELATFRPEDYKPQWRRAKPWIARGLWSLLALAGLLAAAGMLFSKTGLVSAGQRLAMGSARQSWTLLALFTTVLYGLTSVNPWPLLPTSFYAAPAILLVVGIGLRAFIEETQVLEEALDALTPPIVSLMWMAVLGMTPWG